MSKSHRPPNFLKFRASGPLLATIGGILLQFFTLAKCVHYAHGDAATLVAIGAGTGLFVAAALVRRSNSLSSALTLAAFGLTVLSFQAVSQSIHPYSMLIYDPILAVTLVQRRLWPTAVYGAGMLLFNAGNGGDINDLIGVSFLSAILIFFQYLLDRIRRERDNYYKASITDTLSQTFNFSHTLQVGQSLLDRNERPIRILLIDIDDFKSINDTYGHLAGNALIVSVANLLREFAKTVAGIIGRLGGDEFVIVAEDGEDSAAMKMTILRMIREQRFALGKETQLELSFSIGEALSDPNRPERFEELLHQADMNMFRMKQQRMSRSSDGSPRPPMAAVTGQPMNRIL